MKTDTKPSSEEDSGRGSLQRLVGPAPTAWSGSKSEELLSALWLIAALLAWNNNIKWLAWMLFVKAAMDTITSIVLAVIELRAESKPNALLSGMQQKENDAKV